MATLANTGAEAVIPLPNVLMFIAPFALEVVNGVSWAAEEQAGDDGVLQLGVVYQADAFGESGLAAAQYVEANSDNVEIVGTATYTPADQDLTSQAQAMMDSGAEVVWLHVISSQVGKLLGAAQQMGYDPLWLGHERLLRQLERRADWATCSTTTGSCRRSCPTARTCRAWPT